MESEPITRDDVDDLLGAVGRGKKIPTCQFCGGLGHVSDWHYDLDAGAIPAATIRDQIAELRDMAQDIRDEAQKGMVNSPLNISRAGRAEGYEIVAKRLESLIK